MEGVQFQDGEGSGSKKDIGVSVLDDDFQVLKRLRQKMPKVAVEMFKKKRGRLLFLLHISVRAEALSALAQFWNSDLRCFELNELDIVPTIEEYTPMLDLHVGEGAGVYLYQGKYTMVEKVVKALCLLENCVARNKDGGLKRIKLEKHLVYLAENQLWERFVKVMSLLIFGVILFPYNKDEIDLAVIDAYCQFEDNGKCPVPAILAETLRSVDVCRRKKGGKLHCCLQLLYVWITTHCYVPRRLDDSMNALRDFRHLPTQKKRTVQEWKNEGF